ITTNDLAARLQDTPAAYQQYLASAEGRKQFLNLMIREKVLYVEAKRSGLAQDKAYRENLRQFRERMQQRLKDYQESLLVDSYIRQLRSKDLAVPDSEVHRFYDEHKAEFEHPVAIQARHILLNSESDAAEAQKRLNA